MNISKKMPIFFKKSGLISLAFPVMTEAHVSCVNDAHDLTFPPIYFL